MSIVRMTYMGHCKYGNYFILCDSMSAVKEQKPLIYDHTLGLKDTNIGTNTKGSTNTDVGGYNNIQKKIYRMSPILPRVSFSGPVSDTCEDINVLYILDKAISGDSEDVEMTFWKDGNKVTLKGGIVTNFTLNMTAGGVVTFSAEMVGKDLEENENGGSDAVVCSKLVTWNNCEVTAQNADGEVQAFSITISNPVTPFYTAGATDLLPSYLRIGTQEVTGTLSIYAWTFTEDPGTLSFKIGDYAYKLAKVVFHSATEKASGKDMFISTVPFTAINDNAIWEEVEEE